MTFRAILLGFQGSPLVPQLEYVNERMLSLGWDSYIYLMPSERSREAAAKEMDDAFRDLQLHTDSEDDKLVVFYAGYICGAMDATAPNRAAMYCHSESTDSANRSEVVNVNMTPRLQRLWNEMPNDVLLIMQTPWNAAPCAVPTATMQMWGLLKPEEHEGRNVQMMSILYEDSRAPRPVAVHPAYTAPPPLHLREPGWDIGDRLVTFARRGDSVRQLFEELYQNWLKWQTSATVGIERSQILVNTLCGDSAFFRLTSSG
ncbi:uncharacterized protein MYCFIDRAFT_197465 [Pseudocercospora fijiensis CIRAD86]|uniref:Uncharacterized protein n=1 Tax=Pseudocercospora fijiensis (strain CIRAD86) TaxID=383855 RepID=M3ACN7_PSEFD|nr:uncharacterized protein MYCFIDRAFT_197465 [Pseudocercospora fijiensis CIRAD86]EME82306.1 hypothetical protein MYCFIDRAFT_197465 [Pseudocercospora fijiensis CIRAD86]